MKKAFTFIELIVVIVVLSIVSMMGVELYRYSYDHEVRTQAFNALEIKAQAISMFIKAQFSNALPGSVRLKKAYNSNCENASECELIHKNSTITLIQDGKVVDDAFRVIEFAYIADSAKRDGYYDMMNETKAVIDRVQKDSATCFTRIATAPTVGADYPSFFKPWRVDQDVERFSCLAEGNILYTEKTTTSPDGAKDYVIHKINKDSINEVLGLATLHSEVKKTFALTRTCVEGYTGANNKNLHIENHLQCEENDYFPKYMGIYFYGENIPLTTNFIERDLYPIKFSLEDIADAKECLEGSETLPTTAAGETVKCKKYKSEMILNLDQKNFAITAKYDLVDNIARFIFSDGAIKFDLFPYQKYFEFKDYQSIGVSKNDQELAMPLATKVDSFSIRETKGVIQFQLCLKTSGLPGSMLEKDKEIKVCKSGVVL